MDYRGRKVGPCTFVYKDGIRKCAGTLYVDSYKVSSSRVFYVTLLCDKKGNHGKGLPEKGVFASEWGYDQEDTIAALEREDEAMKR